MAGVYSIDGSLVNDRIDWRQRLIPGAVPRVVEGFPGDPSLYVVKGPAYPVGVLVTGFLESATHSGLHDQMRTYSAMQGDLDLHGVTILGSSFSNCELMRFDVTGPQGRGFSSTSGGGVRIRQAVVFHWQETVLP